LNLKIQFADKQLFPISVISAAKMGVWENKFFFEHAFMVLLLLRRAGGMPAVP
jgi:hypothetical protein